MAKFDTGKKSKTPLESFDQAILTIFKKAVEKGDPNRDSLMLTVTGALQLILFRPEIDTQLARSLIEDQIELQLSRMFRIIVESDDFSLFKSAVHSLTLMVSRSTPMLVGLIEDPMYKASMSSFAALKDQQIRKEVERIRFALKFSAREFTRILRVNESIEQLLSKTGEGQSVPDDEKRYVLELYANSLLHRLSFMTMASLLFQFRQGRLERDTVNTYLTELWHHTTPEDADAVIVNVPPVPTDQLWLTLLYLYGGMDSDIWFDRYNFEDFHGTTKYVTQSYLLLLAKIAAPIPIPSNSEIGTYAQLELWNELGELYELARDFLYKTKSSDFTHELTQVKMLGLDDFVTRNRPSKPDDTRTWMEELEDIIRKARNRFSEIQVLVETILPLDQVKRDLCESEIRKAYDRTTLVGEVALLTSCSDSSQLSSLKSFPNRLPPVPKDCFLKVANVDCTMIWGEIGDRVAWEETRHVYETGSNLKPPSAVCEKYDPEKILEVVSNETTKMTEANATPNLAFVPLKLITDWQMHSKLRYEPTQSYLPHPKAKLRLVNSWKGFEFQDIMIVDRKKCEWLYEKFNGSRLRCSISSIESEARKVKIEVESRGLFTPRTEGIRLIKLLELPPL